MYGSYAAQPALGFLDRREGVLGSARLKLNPNWVLMGAARYDIRADELSQTQIGVGYIDDCLILALNYITDYAYSGSVSVNRTFMMQISLRTLGGTSAGQSASGLTSGVSGNSRLTMTPAECGHGGNAARRGGCREGEPSDGRHMSISSIRTRGLLAAAMLALAASVPATIAHAQQVVVIVNGDPITALDIEQRTKLIQLSTHKAPATPSRSSRSSSTKG